MNKYYTNLALMFYLNRLSHVCDELDTYFVRKSIKIAIARLVKHQVLKYQLL